MENHTLFFKNKTIQGSDVEITFHKDFTHIYNIETFPVVKYTLINCEELASINFDDIEYQNDGLFVENREEHNRSVFEATGIAGEVFKIICDEIIREDLEYRKQDYVDLLNEMIKQRDDEHEVVDKYYQQLENLKFFLEKEIDVSERKLNQADWLTNDKRHFVEGELTGLRKVFEVLTNSRHNM
ncbi:hypothetical protein EXU57_08815 [Segetibacter sp. 3557_3]|uniref:hypothetical protein n=1 Tax=Segetibacter sp. 3557_3 TaxID=2547429 RepID=UPI001058721A|nr:hypothetical protein [Segetibacter sp. 3557_3]TDH26897.1 hypothetical protein EXU57_08815 [Segetibacter sp. 3557_3]